MNPVTEFERTFAKLIHSKYAIAVNSGTSALHAALVACNVEDCDVIMPALCPAMDAFAIIHAGGNPIFADVDPLTGLITADTIKAVLTVNTKAIIAVHLHGLSCDMDPILKLANHHTLWVIEDCAQALMATYEDKNVGTIGHIGCFSFEKKKHLTTGSEGGMIITNDEHLAVSARKFAGIGYKHMTADAGRTSLDAAVYQNPDYQRFDTIGLNYRMSEAQARIGLEQLDILGWKVSLRIAMGNLWELAFGEECQPHKYKADNTFYSAVYDYQGDDWHGIYKEFVRRGGDGFYAMPQVPYKEPALANTIPPWADCPIAEGLQKRLMLMKTHYATVDYAKDQCNMFARVLHERS